MITEDYVSLKVAKLLKEKGFNEKVICYYDDGGSLNLNKFVEFQCCNQGYGSNIFAAPTLQMVCKWLREVHYKYCDVGYDIDLKWFIQIIDLTESAEHSYPENGSEFKSYEQACEVAIKYCLENLI